MKIALVTCATVPDWECDDLPFHAALRERGIEFEQPIWDDASVDWASFDRVLIRTTWDYQTNHTGFVAWAERVASQTRLFNPPAIVAWNTNKTYLRELEGEGVTIAPTTWFARGESAELGPLLAGHGSTRGFLKPVIAANSRGTLRFDASDPTELAAAQAWLERMTAVEPMMLQPYLAGVEREGELSAIVFDGVIHHAVRKVPVAGDYRVQDDYGAHDEPLIPAPDLVEFVDRTLAGLAAIARRRGWAVEFPLLYGRVDVLRDSSGALVLNEFELVEPSLFFRHHPRAAIRLAEALLAR